MSDPRKPVHRPQQSDQDAAHQMAHAVLMAATSEGAKMVGCTGASFVIMGIGIWAAELCELDRRAVAKMFEALSVIYDPAANDRQKVKAEKSRRAAVDKLFAALDLEMNPAQGSA